ncbi:PucR family transcriptional regulator [Streptomyces sp. TRM68416]|uniref:PucR family transcriptional regulator n=1 Tax=Streptomyces sp. TRM68416 TaxID=2758412 RepID=UPI001661AE07|nr:PucR family transcriptional regulator [Streptomyces sp. TRM68416]MBD0842146.1 helix-turn-helix domain-containing protein [Streptomyces sp. TRM68416]
MSRAEASASATLTSLLDAVGDTLLTPLEAPFGLDVPVDELEILDPPHPIGAVPRTMLFAIGAGPDSPEAEAALTVAAEAGYTALVVKLHGKDPAGLRSLAREQGIALLAADDEVNWRHLDGLLSAVLATRSGHGPAGGDGEWDDLFDLANATAAQLHGAVAIMDDRYRIIAYSTISGQPTDEARRQGILGREVPQAFRAVHADPRLRQRPCPVRFTGHGTLPRVAVGILAGRVVLGSLWVIDADDSLGPEGERTLQDAADLAALRLLRHRNSRDLARRAREQALRGALLGEDLPHTGALGSPGPGFVVAAFEHAETESDVSEPEMAHIIELITGYAQVQHFRASTVQLDGVVYTLLPADPSTAGAVGGALASSVLERIRVMLGVRLRAGIGGHAATLSAVQRSRQEADTALGVLAHRGQDHAVADFQEVRAESFFLRLRADLDAFDEVRPVGLEAMREHDALNGTEYTSTVYAYLRCLGDSARAAAEMYVHPNTLRYRIKRAGELFGIDLKDPDEALLLWLRLRLQH